MQTITKEELDSLKENLSTVLGEDSPENDTFEAMIRLLGLPDDDFVILAPGVMQSYQQMLNNPNDKIALVQALNVTGNKAEDLTEAFDAIIEEIEQLNMPKIKRDFLKEMIGSISNAINDTEGIAKRLLAVPIELCHPDAKVPQYAHISDSGMDVYALEEETIKPGEIKLMPTGIKVALPAGFELQVRPKSGRALKTKLRIANTPGTIDQGYRDEIKIIIENVEPPIKDISYEFDENGRPIITSIEHGRDYVIGKGEKFCQLVLAEVPKVSFYRVDTVNGIGEDRQGGFGSTGLK